MKPTGKVSKIFSRFFLMPGCLLTSAIAFAQDKDVNINVNTKGNRGLFAEPSVWIVIGVTFIVLIITLLRPARTKVIKE